MKISFVIPVYNEEKGFLKFYNSLLLPELEKLHKECAEWCEQEEDVLSYAQFDRVAVKFFENRRNKKAGIDSEHFDSKNKVHPV